MILKDLLKIMPTTQKILLREYKYGVYNDVYTTYIDIGKYFNYNIEKMLSVGDNLLEIYVKENEERDVNNENN